MRMIDMERELALFLHACLIGMILLACYVVLAVIRRLFCHRKWMVHLEDIGYWTGVSIYLFVQFYHTNNGKIRWFSVLGIVIGALFLWKTLLSLEKGVKKMYDFARRKMGKTP